jgi:phage head maturation protease
MRVDIEFYFNKDDDGFDGSTRVSRDNVEDLYEVSRVITDAINGAGFSYVEDTAFQKNNGEELWGLRL